MVSCMGSPRHQSIGWWLAMERSEATQRGRRTERCDCSLRGCFNSVKALFAFRFLWCGCSMGSWTLLLARRSPGACWASNPGRGAWIGRFEAFAVRWCCSQRLLSVGHHSPQTCFDAFSKWHIKHNSRNCCVGGGSKVPVSAIFFGTISQSQRSSTTRRPSHDFEIRGNALMDASLTLPWSLRAVLASAWSFSPVPWHDVGPFLLMILDPRLPFGWHFIRQYKKSFQNVPGVSDKGWFTLEAWKQPVNGPARRNWLNDLYVLYIDIQLYYSLTCMLCYVRLYYILLSCLMSRDMIWNSHFAYILHENIYNYNFLHVCIYIYIYKMCCVYSVRQNYIYAYIPSIICTYIRISKPIII